MKRIGRKIRELCKEFVGLQEVIVQVTIEPRKSFRRPVTEIRVKRVDENLLSRVLEESWSGGACFDHWIDQRLFLDGTPVSIETKGINHSMAAHAVRNAWEGEEIREALRRVDLASARFLVLVEFERYSDEHNHREYNRVTVYKPSRGNTIQEDVWKHIGLLELQCSCGASLQAFRPDDADTFGGEEGTSVPCYGEFDPWWDEEPVDPEDITYGHEQWVEFEECGMYCANLNDAMRYGINNKTPIHDIYSADGRLFKFGSHTSVAA